MTFFTVYHDPESGWKYRLFGDGGRQVQESDWSTDMAAFQADVTELVAAQAEAAKPEAVSPVVTTRKPRKGRKAR